MISILIGSYSQIWKRDLKSIRRITRQVGESLFERNLRKLIGDGRDSKFRFDLWID